MPLLLTIDKEDDGAQLFLTAWQWETHGTNNLVVRGRSPARNFKNEADVPLTEHRAMGEGCAESDNADIKRDGPSRVK